VYRESQNIARCAIVAGVGANRQGTVSERADIIILGICDEGFLVLRLA
jgi:hypothetical protein